MFSFKSESRVLKLPQNKQKSRMWNFHYMNIISNQTIFDQFSGAEVPNISISIMIIVQFLLKSSDGAGETQFNGCCFYSLEVRLNCLAKVLLTVWIVQKCKHTSVFSNFFIWWPSGSLFTPTFGTPTFHGQIQIEWPWQRGSLVISIVLLKLFRKQRVVDLVRGHGWHL